MDPDTWWPGMCMIDALFLGPTHHYDQPPATLLARPDTHIQQLRAAEGALIIVLL